MQQSHGHTWWPTLTYCDNCGYATTWNSDHTTLCADCTTTNEIPA